MANKRDIIACLGEGVPSLGCTGGKTENDYYVTYNIWSNGKARYCKKCLDKIYENYYKKSGESDKIALYYTLIQINTPLISEIYTKLKAKNDKVTINKYMTEFAKYTQRRTVWGDFSSTDIKLVDTESGNLNTNEELDKLEKIWGVQDNIKDYEFLEDTFTEYTQDREDMSVSETNQYRWLCRDTLLLRKINDGSYNGEETIDKIQSRINKTMSILKIDKFEEKKVFTLSEQMIANKVAMIEQLEPADLYKEPKKYKDFNNVRKYYKDICLRPLLNTLVGNKDFDISVEDMERYNLEEEE